MDAHTHGQADVFVLFQAGIQRPDRPHNLQTSVDSAPGIILVRLGVANVDQQAIAQVLGNMALKALEDLSGCSLVGLHYLAVFFRVQLARKPCRVHQITEHHRELAPFGPGGRRFRW
jgi:hypothetical protein